MTRIIFTIYNFFFLPLFYLLIKIYSLFNSKVRKGIQGRKDLFNNLELRIKSINKGKRLIWFHSSSLGEFEQAKPIIEKIKKEKDYNILITFFSPSGYENSLKYPYADIVSYLPLDTKKNIRNFVSMVEPVAVILMRYDIWPNMVDVLSDKNIPLFIVDATMRKNSKRKLPVLKSFHSFLFSRFTKILTISEFDKHEFKVFGIPEEKLRAVGDTRFDRVYQRSIVASSKNLINKEVIEGKKILVAGSTWEQDEEIIIPVIKKLTENIDRLMIIIAPHEPSIQHIEKLENDFQDKLKTIRFSHLNEYKDEQIIIVDSIGILLTLYTYADAAFIGGSFKSNVHNVLEAAVYGIPVLFGPKIENSQEAKQLLAHGAAFRIASRKEAYKVMRNLFTNDDLLIKMGKESKKFVQKNIGATERITSELLRYL